MLLYIFSEAQSNLEYVHSFQHKHVCHFVYRFVQVCCQVLEQHLAPIIDGFLHFFDVAGCVVVLGPDVHRIEILKL